MTVAGEDVVHEVFSTRQSPGVIVSRFIGLLFIFSQIRLVFTLVLLVFNLSLPQLLPCLILIRCVPSISSKLTPNQDQQGELENQQDSESGGLELDTPETASHECCDQSSCFRFLHV